MNKRLNGSYTVEASFVMAVILFSLMMSIQSAYRLRDEVAGAMALAETVQRLRHNETESPGDAINWAVHRAGTPFSWKEYQFELNLSGNLLTGKRIKGTGVGGRWKLELEQQVFDPENFLRKLTLISQEE
ncbi:MAG: hypothetical protein E7249_12955 [Paenibacillaceae bacterium]|nr:hypothetical protein [Paenibacillaceae bacterium]